MSSQNQKSYLKTYKTNRGVNVIAEYIENVDDLNEALQLADIVDEIDQKGAKWLFSDECPIWTEHWDDKIYEIKYNQHRVFYCYMKGNVVYMLHGCKKVKGKTTPKDSKIVKKRFKEVIKKK